MDCSMIVNIRNEKISLEVTEKLGEGAFGTVVRAVDNRGVSFAVKAVLCNDQDTYEAAAQEVEILLTLKHPNIVAMYAFDFINFTAVLIMEFCSQGTLNKRLDRPVDVLVQLQWMDQLGNALSYLHDKNIVHRDLKTENVLLSGSNDVKIADFGIARHFVCCRRGRRDFDANAYISEYLDAFMGTFAGTPYWVAPEVFNNHYTEKADIFSLGVIFHAICERQWVMYDGERYYGSFTKYNGIDTGVGLVMFELHRQVQLLFTQTRSEILKNTICSMTQINAENRISLLDLRNAINESYLEVLQLQEGPTDEIIDDNTTLLTGKHKKNTAKKGDNNVTRSSIAAERQGSSETKGNTEGIHLNLIEDREDKAFCKDTNECTCSKLCLLICCRRCNCEAKYKGHIVR